MNRVREAIDRIKPKIEVLEESKRIALDKGLKLDFEEHFTYQNLQAKAHAMGKITTEEAQIIYCALGEVPSVENGNWASDTDLPVKVVVTRLMVELLESSIKENKI